MYIKQFCVTLMANLTLLTQSGNLSQCLKIKITKASPHIAYFVFCDAYEMKQWIEYLNTS